MSSSAAAKSSPSTSTAAASGAPSAAPVAAVPTPSAAPAPAEKAGGKRRVVLLSLLGAFIATGAGSLQMAFGTTSADNIGPLLDNVRLDVSAVPEPATWAMMLLGLGFVGGAMRSRRRKQNVAVRYA